MKKMVLLFLLIFGFSMNVYASEFTELAVNGKSVRCSGYNCEIELESTSAVITYTLADTVLSASPNSGHTVSLTSDTTVNIMLKLKDGSEANYSLKIIKYVPSGDTSIESLRINDEKVEVIKDVYVYSYNVSYDDETVRILAVPTDKKALCLLEEYPFPLENSSTSVEYYVTAPNGDKRKYTFNIRRKNKPDTTLKSLTLSDINFNFDPKTLSYSVVVPFRLTTTTVKASANSSDAKITIEKPDTFKIGENEVTIKVTNGDASSNYVIKVKRLEDIDETVVNLTKLTIRGTEIEFDPDVLEYDLYFESIPTKLYIDYTQKDSEAIVGIEGNERIADKSIVLIKVSHEIGLSKTYKLVVHQLDGAKNEPTSANKSDDIEMFEKDAPVNKILVVILIIVLVIVMIVLFILQVKDKKKGKKKKSKKSKVEEDIEII